VRDDRPGLAGLLEYVRAGDTVVVVALDRLGRSLSGVIRTVETLTAAGVLLRSLREGIDYSTPTARSAHRPAAKALRSLGPPGPRPAPGRGVDLRAGAQLRRFARHRLPRPATGPGRGGTQVGVMTRTARAAAVMDVVGRWGSG